MLKELYWATSTMSTRKIPTVPSPLQQMTATSAFGAEPIIPVYVPRPIGPTCSSSLRLFKDLGPLDPHPPPPRGAAAAPAPAVGAAAQPADEAWGTGKRDPNLSVGLSLLKKKPLDVGMCHLRVLKASQLLLVRYP